MANTTGRKFGGRRPGTKNKRSQELAELMKEMKAEPAVFLANVMLGDRRAFGYEDKLAARERNHELKVKEIEDKNKLLKKDKKPLLEIPELRELTKAEKDEFNLLPLDTRIEAAKELMPYLHAKLRPVDKDGDTGTSELAKILGIVDGTIPEDEDESESED